MTLSAVVLTMGRSPLFVPCLEALRREGVEIVVVDQGVSIDVPAGLADQVLRPGRNLGFAAGNNLGLSAATGDLVAPVNDDLLVAPGWAERLLAALAADPGAGSAQGVNLVLDHPDLADGCGIAWNRWWQAVQVGHGEPAPGPEGAVSEIFGVSATAAVYRREALREVAPDGEVFDNRLGFYYEDVDLACRLRAAGWRALLVPAARALHAGSLTGRTMSRQRWMLVYGNRWVVVKRYLGGGFWPRVPLLAVRDGLDLGWALLERDTELAAGIVSGWGRALRGGDPR
ncbi:MAG: glycosyltransferase family 2 protein [Thermoanaerobaculia bacterium]